VLVALKESVKIQTKPNRINILLGDIMDHPKDPEIPFFVKLTIDGFLGIIKDGFLFITGVNDGNKPKEKKEGEEGPS
jgi:hypothetical protein